MKLVKAILLSAVLLGANAPGLAKADGFGWGLGLGLLIGAPLIASTYYRPYYYAPYGYAPYAYGYAPAYSRPWYVQQVPAPAQRPVQQVYSWYYCPSASGYYPYVRHCPGGWQQVSPTPPGL